MILIDTGVIIAFHNPNDQFHFKAVNIFSKYAEQDRFISDYIFDEAVTLSLARASHHQSVAVGRSLLEGDVRMIKVGEEIFAKAWKIFQHYDYFSFTDCTSLAIIDLFHIKKIATFDSGFSKRKDIEIVNS